MVEALVNLVFLGLMILAVIVCTLAPVAAIGLILWKWRTEPIGTGGLLKSSDGHEEDL